jgi:hypothetical protein
MEKDLIEFIRSVVKEELEKELSQKQTNSQELEGEEEFIDNKTLRMIVLIERLFEKRDERLVEKLGQYMSLMQKQQIDNIISLANEIAEAKLKQQSKSNIKEEWEAVKGILKEILDMLKGLIPQQTSQVPTVQPSNIKVSIEE